MNTVADTCPHHPRGVPEGHLCDAQYVLVGEAPGEREDETGLPFVGQAGFVQDQLWKDAGISRQREVYITNVLGHRPTPFSNDIKLAGKEEIARASKELVDRLRRRFPSPPAVLVPTGNTALFALTGRNGIQKWRGSIIEADLVGPGWWAVPIIHPAALLRTPALAKTCLADWCKAKAVAVDGLRPVLGREHIIHPSKQERDLFLELVNRDPTRPISIDIETRRSDGGIICVGFGYSEKLSCSYMWEHRKWINTICSLSNPKILVNGFFDCWYLHRAGIEVVNFVWDLPCMFHCLDPAAGPTAKGKDKEGERSRIKCYSLAYTGSIFTTQPYWKDDAKEEGEGSRVYSNEKWWKTFLNYNGIDCTATWEAAMKVAYHLDRGINDWYKCIHGDCEIKEGMLAMGKFELAKRIRDASSGWTQ